MRKKLLPRKLWFGDERGYNATNGLLGNTAIELWFGDERGYNATNQHIIRAYLGCGLVMKEDITQLQTPCYHTNHRCGLVMKEDITQLFYVIVSAVNVVVW